MRVEVQNLSRHFGKVKAVDGISFAFGEGEVIGFVGPNGAGKTTTMRIMATLDEPTFGRVLIDGVCVQAYPEKGREMLGYMPDALPEHADMTAHEYVDFFGRAFGFHGAKLRSAVEEVETFTGITVIRDKTLKSLSKGMKQRVSLARALVHGPRLLIMDEPANGLDPRARIELRELVRTLAENGTAILVSSHILTELSEMCTGVVVMEHGKLAGTGTLTQLMAGRQEAARRIFVRALQLEAKALHKRLLEHPGVTQAFVQGDGCVAEIENSDEKQAALIGALITQGVMLAECRVEQIGLEHLFMSMTKGDLA